MPVSMSDRWHRSNYHISYDVRYSNFLDRASYSSVGGDWAFGAETHLGKLCSPFLFSCSVLFGTNSIGRLWSFNTSAISCGCWDATVEVIVTSYSIQPQHTCPTRSDEQRQSVRIICEYTQFLQMATGQFAVSQVADWSTRRNVWFIIYNK